MTTIELIRDALRHAPDLTKERTDEALVSLSRVEEAYNNMAEALKCCDRVLENYMDDRSCGRREARKALSKWEALK